MRLITLPASCLIAVSAMAQPCEELQAGFSYGPLEGGILFANTTTGTGFQTQWQWDFGDGTNGDGAQPFHIFPGPGTYEVCLTVVSLYETSSGVITCTDTQCNPVVVGGGGNNCDWLQACFEIDPLSPSAFFFDNCTPNETGSIYLWTFGDGTSANSYNAEHAYEEPGVYEVCLTATWEDCTSTICMEVVVQGNACQGLQAGFTYAPLEGGIQFSNTTTGTGFQTQWQWDFGDGTNGDGAQPSHIYEEPGVYEVCLTAISLYETSEGVITCTDVFCLPVVQTTAICGEEFELIINSILDGGEVLLTAIPTIAGAEIYWTIEGTDFSGGALMELPASSDWPVDVCVSAWYYGTGSPDTCWVELCGSVTEAGMFMTGIRETANSNSDLVAYPNPTSGMVTLSGEALQGKGSLRVFTADGRLELEQQAQAWPQVIDLSRLSSGLHMVVLTEHGRSWRVPVVRE